MIAERREVYDAEHARRVLAARLAWVLERDAEATERLLRERNNAAMPQGGQATWA